MVKQEIAAVFTAAISILVDLMGFEPTASWTRTERARKVVSFLPMDCEVWSAKNESYSRCFLCKFYLTVWNHSVYPGYAMLTQIPG